MHRGHGRSLLIARFGLAWERGFSGGLGTFPPHIVVTEPFYPRIPIDHVRRGDLGDPFDIALDSRTLEVRLGFLLLKDTAAKLLDDVGEVVTLIEHPVAANVGPIANDNVFTIRGFELVRAVDAKHHAYRVE